jgi:hypothetical protein
MIATNARAYNTAVLIITVKSFIVHATRREHQGRLSTIDLLVHVACFAKNERNIFRINSSQSELVTTRR